MAMLLRRRSGSSSCFQLLTNTRLHQSFPLPLSLVRSSTENRDLFTLSRVPELDVQFRVPQALRTATRVPTWRPEECGRSMRSAHSDREEIQTLPKENIGAGSGKLILYRAKWIRPIRLLVRLKLIQLGGVVALAIPLAEYSQQGSLSLGTTLAVGAVVGGAGAASAALWYYSRRLVGEMALLLPDLGVVQISVLDFWGNREDLRFDVSDIVAPLKGMTKEELERAAQQIVIPLDVIGGRQFFLSLRHGHLLHKDILFSILNGSIEARDMRNTEPPI